MTRIKICGLQRIEDVENINRIRPDFAGFIINVEKSKRNIDVSLLKKLSSRLDRSIVPVGVFVDAPKMLVMELIEDGVIGAAQFHGSETDVYIDNIKNYFSAKGRRPMLIKAIKVKNESDIIRANVSAAPMILLDGGAGEGKSFDWSLLKLVNRPYILAGGLNEKNVKTAVSLRPWAVDVSSGAETFGVKDPEKMMRLVSVIRGMEMMNERMR